MEARGLWLSLFPVLLGGIAGAGRGGVLLSDGTLLKETTMEKIFQIELRKVYPLLVAKAELQNK